MTTFLDKILATKEEEVRRLKDEQSRGHLRVPDTLAPCRGFASAIRAKRGLAVVAEVKKASPSKGLIAPNFDPVHTAKVYERGHAAAISVLTDETYFQGAIRYLTQVHDAVEIPVLRKDFIIDEVQLDEARIAGADAALLIVAALDASRLQALVSYAHHLGLDVLIEVHNEAELQTALGARPDVLGINNRNLHTFEVSLETTKSLMKLVPTGIPVLAESGIHQPADALDMASCGARGILVGESLMRLGDDEAILDKLRSFGAVTSLDYA